MTNRIAISKTEADEREDRAALRFYSAIFAGCTACGFAALFILDALPASWVTYTGLFIAGAATVAAGGAAVVTLLWSIPGFVGDDAFRS